MYRHDYEDVAAQHVWDTVKIDLPPLGAVIQRELAEIGDEISYSLPLAGRAVPRRRAEK